MPPRAIDLTTGGLAMSTDADELNEQRELRIAHLEETVDALALEVEKLREEVRALDASLRQSRVD
jgi:hypothetical protein